MSLSAAAKEALTAARLEAVRRRVAQAPRGTKLVRLTEHSGFQNSKYQSSSCLLVIFLVGQSWDRHWNEFPERDRVSGEVHLPPNRTT